MLNRLALAFSKLIFCIRVSAGCKTFFKLVYNTKKLKWYKKSGATAGESKEAAAYNFIINGKRYTILLRTLEGDIDIFYEIFWKKIYSLPAANLSGPNKVFVDLGANIGMAALYFHAFHDPALIICVEPASENFKLLVKNTSSIKNSKLVNAAVMASEGWVKMKSELLHYNYKAAAAAAGEESVKAITVSSIYTQYNLTEVAVLKIDIEGAEEEIFRQDAGFLDIAESVVIEIHSPESGNICLQTLAKKGYAVVRGGKDGKAATVFLASRH